MKVSLMFTLVSLFFIIYGTQATEIYRFSGPEYQANEVHLIPLPLRVPHNVSGSITFNLVSSLDIILCVQERVQLTAGLSSCNPEGYLTFFQADAPPPTESDIESQYLNNLPGRRYWFADEPRLTKNSTDLKTERDYWLSFIAPTEVRANMTNTTQIEISVTTDKDECKGAGYGPLCLDSYPILTPQGLIGDFVQGNVQYYEIPEFDFTFSQVLNFELKPVDPNRTLHLSAAIRRGAFPTRDQYDLYFVNQTSFSFNISNPRPDEWFIALWNLDSSAAILETYQFNASAYVLACNASAPLHTGPSCNSGITVLQAPSYLLDNNTVDAALTEETDLEKGELVYFEVKTNRFILGVASEDEDDPTPAVFVDIDFIPSGSSFLLSNTNETELVHLFDVTLPSTKGYSNDQWWMPSFLLSDHEDEDERTWYIGVNATSDYVMWLNFPCANNCTDRGTCDVTTGICMCDDDDYEGFDCGSKPFPLVWIILIAIGGAILLAIAIGVPVSCYIKNKRRSDYTRV